jgi:predicted lipoprotein
MKKGLFYIIISTLIFTSCKRDKDIKNQDNFDREAMLKNYAEELIIPAYEELNLSIQGLLNSINSFESNITLQNLNNVKLEWQKTYSVWITANAFNIGPASEQGLNKSLNEEIATFPISESKIQSAVETGNLNFNDFNRDARGFLALEYILFNGPNTSEDSVLNLFTIQTNRTLFLKQCAQNIQTRVARVLSEWQTTYKNEFIARNGTDVGSSTSQLYNEFVKSFETIKNLKIELPLGKRPGQIQIEPKLVEAYYSGLSLDFLKIHIQNIERIYLGQNKNGQDGLGFKDYLETVTNGKELVVSTLKQWENVNNTLNKIPTNAPLSEIIRNNSEPVEDLRIELQKHTRFFKSDMSSLLGIAITYSSGDGD